MSIFDSLIGNNDRHNENISFIAVGKFLVLSPIYDNTTGVIAVADENGLSELTTKILVDGKPGTMESILTACNNIDTNATKKFAKEILKSKDKIKNAIRKDSTNKTVERLFSLLIDKQCAHIESFLKRRI